MREVVLFFGTFVMPDKNAAAIRVYGLAKVLKEIGYKVLLAGDNRGEDVYIEIENNIGYFNRKHWGNINYYFNADYAISRIQSVGVDSINSIILYHTPPVIALKILRFCRKFDISVIADTTEWYSVHRQLNSGNVVLKSLNFWSRMHITNRIIHNNIVISSFLESYYNEKKCNVLKIPILSINKYPRIDRNDSAVQFCYCGSPSKKDLLLPIVKGFEKAIDEGLNAILVIVGCSLDQFEKINGYSINQKYLYSISFLGRVPHTEALRIVSSSNFSFIIRPDERYARAGFPTKMIEAFTCGTGVIASSVGDIPEYVIDSENGFLVSSTSSNSVYEIIKRICGMNKEDLVRISNNAYLSADQFSPCMFTEEMRFFLSKCDNTKKRD